MHSEDDPLRLCAREPVSHQLCVVIALGRHGLVGRVSETLLRFIDPGAVLRRNGIFPQRLRHLAAELWFAPVHSLCHEKARYPTHRSEACRADGREDGEALFQTFQMLHTITPFSMIWLNRIMLQRCFPWRKAANCAKTVQTVHSVRSL